MKALPERGFPMTLARIAAAGSVALLMGARCVAGLAIA
jgi:hypothetical protein